jgi:hypothetical protein
LELHINYTFLHVYYLWKYRSLHSWPNINLSTMYVFGLSRYLLSPTSLINLLDFNITLWLHRCFKHFETLLPHIHNLSYFPPMNFKTTPHTHTFHKPIDGLQNCYKSGAIHFYCPKLDSHEIFDFVTFTNCTINYGH